MAGRSLAKLHTRSWLIAATLLAASAGGSRAQAPNSDNEAKILRCSQNTLELIWLDREKLRDRCGIWSSTYTVKSPAGEVERMVYSRYFVVTMRNGVVSSVRKRRQIFTGFGKKS